MDWAQSMLGEPFAWGETDCFMLALAALDAMCGTGLAGEWRGRWHDRASSMKYMLKRRTHAMKEFEAIGLVPIGHGFRQAGDILVIDPGDNEIAEAMLRKRIGVGYLLTHVCLGAQSLCAHPERGIFLQPTEALIAAPARSTVLLRMETACLR